MPHYQKLGEIPRKHHIWFHRNGAGPGYKNEGIYYEHVITTEGFNEAYSIMYHLRPPTRVRNVEAAQVRRAEESGRESVAPSSSASTANMPRRGDLYSGRVPILFNQDMTAWRCRPEKDLRTISVLQKWRRRRNYLRLQRRRHGRIAFRQATLSRGRLHRHSARHHLPARAGQS